MIPAGQAIIRSGALAKELGVSNSTLAKWSRTKLRPARYGRGVWLVAKLRELGVLPKVEAQELKQAPILPGLGGLVVVTVEELRRLIREEIERASRP